MKRVPGSIPNIIAGFCKEVAIFTAVQLNKNIKLILNYFLAPLLFGWICFSIYRQIEQQPHLAASWKNIVLAAESWRIIYCIIPVLLILVNWGIEAWKWQISVAPVQPISFWQSFKAVLSGVSFSVSMPNRVGEYLGRVVYLPEGSRLKTISVTLVGSFAQLLVTLVAGLAGLIILKKPLQEAYPGIFIWYQFLQYGLMAVILVMTLMYFRISGVVGIFHKWIRNRKYLYLVEALNAFDNELLFRVLFLSALRYCVFMLQYIMLFYFFGVELQAMLMAWVMSVVFLALAIIPSVSLVELGIRGEVSLKLMGVFSANSLGISLTSVTIWFINLIVPAIIGSLLLANQKIFGRIRKRNEEKKRSDILQ